MIREVERFQARGKDGRVFTIIRRAKQISYQPLNGEIQYRDGGEVLQLPDGSHVNELVPCKRYQVFDTDEVLERE